MGIISCSCVCRRREMDVEIKVKKVISTKDVIIFNCDDEEKSGSYSAWVGAMKRILKKGEKLQLHVCDWGHGEWNPCWIEEFESYKKTGRKKMKSSKAKPRFQKKEVL